MLVKKFHPIYKNYQIWKDCNYFNLLLLLLLLFFNSNINKFFYLYYLYINNIYRYIADNDIKELPKEISNLKNLKSMYVKFFLLI